MTLLGTWVALVPGKFIETRRVRRHDRRLISLAAGLLVGIIGTVSLRTFTLGLTAQDAFFSRASNLEPVYFGALYTIMAGWSVDGGPRPQGAIPLPPDSVDRHALSHAPSVLAV